MARPESPPGIGRLPALAVSDIEADFQGNAALYLLCRATFDVEELEYLSAEANTVK